MSTFDSKSDEYKAGWLANCEGVSLPSNPHADDSGEYDDWENGWLESFDNSDAGEEQHDLLKSDIKQSIPRRIYIPIRSVPAQD